MKQTISLPQNRYNETGIYGGDLSRAFYMAIKGVMELNPSAEFRTTPLSRTEEIAKEKGVEYDFESVRKSVGNPFVYKG